MSEIDERNLFFFIGCWVDLGLGLGGRRNGELDVLGIGFIQFVAIAFLAAELGVHFELKKLGDVIKMCLLFCFLAKLVYP